MDWVWVSAFRPTYTLFLIFRPPHRFNRRASLSIRNAKHTNTHKTSFGVRCDFFCVLFRHPVWLLQFSLASCDFSSFVFFSIERFMAHNKIDRIGGGENRVKLHGKDETKTRKENKKTHTQLDLYRVRKSMKLVREPNAKRNVLSFDLDSFCLCQHKDGGTRKRERESEENDRTKCVGCRYL